MTTFSDDNLEALGAWQNGWGEVQSRREILAENLCKQAESLSSEFRTVQRLCYRKRFIHKGEMVDLFLKDSRDEGVSSWTLDPRFAERLKGLTREGAVSGAIFEHMPTETEVVVSFPALWNSHKFREAVKLYSAKGGIHAKALLNFRDTQHEVVLKTPLRSSEMIALTGASSPFEDLCDMMGIPEDKRDGIFKVLTDNGTYPGEVQYIDREATQRAITRSIQRIYFIVKEQLELQSTGHGV
jgi:hypothetical protein